MRDTPPPPFFGLDIDRCIKVNKWQKMNMEQANSYESQLLIVSQNAVINCTNKLPWIAWQKLPV